MDDALLVDNIESETNLDKKLPSALFTQFYQTIRSPILVLTKVLSGLPQALIVDNFGASRCKSHGLEAL